MSQWSRLPRIQLLSSEGTLVSFLSDVHRNGANSHESFGFRQLSQGRKSTPTQNGKENTLLFDSLIQIIRLAVKTNLPIGF